MYERFYRLRERPFALTPDPDYLYPSRVHKEALSYLRYGIESHAGFIVITGAIGSGKTTLLQTMLRGLDGQTTVARLMNTLLDPRELLESAMLDLGLTPTAESKPAMLKQLGEFLVEERSAGRLVLLVIDEAQNLSLPALEEIRMLSNLETEKSKLIQIVLVGQPDLRDKLDRPELEQLRQRITVSYHLEALDAEETAHYVNHRLARASIASPLEFGRDVTDRIHARSGGVPRLINVIADAALVFGYGEERSEIDAPLIDEVIADLDATGVLGPMSDSSRHASVVSAIGAPAKSGPRHAAGATCAQRGRRTASPGPGRPRAAAAPARAGDRGARARSGGTAPRALGTVSAAAHHAGGPGADRTGNSGRMAARRGVRRSERPGGCGHGRWGTRTRPAERSGVFSPASQTARLLAPRQNDLARQRRTRSGGFAVNETDGIDVSRGRHFAQARARIDGRTARVGVVGLGYVGLPLAVEFARAGFVATGIDLDPRKVDAINHGELVHPGRGERPKSRAWSPSRTPERDDRLRHRRRRSTRSISASRHRCARRRIPTCRTSCRPSIRSPRTCIRACS